MKQNALDLAGKWKMRFLPVWNDDSYLTVPRGGAGMGITAASDNKEEARRIHRGSRRCQGAC